MMCRYPNRENCKVSRENHGLSPFVTSIGANAGDLAGVGGIAETQRLGDIGNETVVAWCIVEVGMADVGTKVCDESGGEIATEGMAGNGEALALKYGGISKPRLHLSVERQILRIQERRNAIENEIIDHKIQHSFCAANGKVFRATRDSLKDGGGCTGGDIGVLGDDVPGGGEGGGLGGGHADVF